MRSYQILTIIGALFVIYDLIFVARQISLSILFVNVFAIISMFLFKNNTKSIGIGLIVLSVAMLYSIGNFGECRSNSGQMEFGMERNCTSVLYTVFHRCLDI
jgi:hypothetical protein